MNLNVAIKRKTISVFGLFRQSRCDQNAETKFDNRFGLYSSFEKLQHSIDTLMKEFKPVVAVKKNLSTEKTQHQGQFLKLSQNDVPDLRLKKRHSCQIVSLSSSIQIFVQRIKHAITASEVLESCDFTKLLPMEISPPGVELPIETLRKS